MADKLGLGTEIRELKIGQSFITPKSKAFHTMKYDFKPASVDTNKKATVEVPGVNQVTVTVPHLDGAGIPQTVFKGSQKPYTKECVLIIDRVTGEITLEKLGCNIQVKKTRSEYNKPHIPKADRLNQQSNERSGSGMSSNSSKQQSLPMRSQTPPSGTGASASGSANHGGVGHRVSNKTKVASGSRRGADRQITHLVPKHSPLHASPSYPSPGHPVKSPKRDLLSSVNELHNQNSTLASLPMIGIDDFSDLRPPSRNAHSSSAVHNSRTQNSNNHRQTTEKRPAVTPVPALKVDNGIGEITDTSSSSSGSDSDSDENTTVANKNINNVTGTKLNGYSNGSNNNNSSPMKIDTRLLNDDLCLSESGSDSD